MPIINKIPDKVEFQQLENSKKFIVYHTNWSTYSDYQVSDLPIDYIPEISYSFFNLDEKGNVFSGDPWADFEKKFNKSQQEYYGNLGEFLKLKNKGKKFNLTLSIGGWSWSKFFSSAVSSEISRNVFVNSIIDLLKKYSIFSGISLDWEYYTNDGNNYGNIGNITNKNDTKNFKEFLKLLRNTLNKNGYTSYKISTCISGSRKIAELGDIKQLEEYVDEFHIMTYDFMGFNNGKTGHHTNLKKCDYCDFSVEDIVEYFLQIGVKSTKLFIGAASYTRGFKNTNGPGSTGVGSNESFKYNNLPKEGFVEYWDPKCLAPFLYNKEKKEYISYDNNNSIYEKSKYVWNKNLGGIILWETSGDLNISDPKSLILSLYKYLLKDPRTVQPPNLPLTWPNKNVSFNDTPKEPVVVPKEPTFQLPEEPQDKLPNDSLPDPVVQLPKTPLFETPKEYTTWELNKIYNIGDIVSFKDKKYLCISPHKSVVGWDPTVGVGTWRYISCNCKKIKTIKIKGEIDMNNIEILYE